MNKQRYLAELQRLLVFMSDEDRELVIRRYGEIFDAWPEGEEAAAEVLESPTKTAIRLSRGYAPGEIESWLPPVPEPPAPEPEPEPAPPAEEKPEVILPDYDVPKTPSPREETPASPVQKVGSSPAKAPAAAGEEDADGEDDWPELPRRGARTPVVYERSVPLGAGIPLFILLVLALAIPLGLLCAALTVIFLAPGAAVLFGAYLLFVGGLWCLSIVADAILLFGAAMIVLALSIFLLWFGFWLAARIWKLWGRGMGWLAGELLGRRVTAYE